MTPADVDLLSFRDLNAMLAGAMRLERERQRFEMERAVIIGASFHNPKIPKEIHKQLTTKNVPTMSLEEYRRQRDAALKKVARRYGDSRTS